MIERVLLTVAIGVLLFLYVKQKNDLSQSISDGNSRIASLDNQLLFLHDQLTQQEEERDHDHDHDQKKEEEPPVVPDILPDAYDAPGFAPVDP